MSDNHSVELTYANQTGEDAVIFIHLGKVSPTNGDLYTDPECLSWQSTSNPASIYSGDNATNLAKYDSATKIDGTRTIVIDIAQARSITFFTKVGELITSSAAWAMPKALVTSEPATARLVSAGPAKGISVAEFTLDTTKVFFDLSMVDGVNYTLTAKYENGTDPDMDVSGIPSILPTTPGVPSTGFWPNAHDVTTYTADMPVLVSDKYFLPLTVPIGFLYNVRINDGVGYSRRTLIAAAPTRSLDGSYTAANPINQHASRLFAAYLANEGKVKYANDGNVDELGSFIGWIRGAAWTSAYSWAFDEITAPLTDPIVGLGQEGLGYTLNSSVLDMPNAIGQEVDFAYLNREIPNFSSPYAFGGGVMWNATSGQPPGAADGSAPTEDKWWPTYTDSSHPWFINTGVLQTGNVLAGDSKLGFSFSSLEFLNGKESDPSATPVTVVVPPAPTPGKQFTSLVPSSMLGGEQIIAWGNAFSANATSAKIGITVDGSTAVYNNIPVTVLTDNTLSFTAPAFEAGGDAVVTITWDDLSTSTLNATAMVPPPVISPDTPVLCVRNTNVTLTGEFFSPDDTKIIIVGTEGSYDIDPISVAVDGKSLIFTAPNPSVGSTLFYEYELHVTTPSGGSNLIFFVIVYSVTVPYILGDVGDSGIINAASDSSVTVQGINLGTVGTTTIILGAPYSDGPITPTSVSVDGRTLTFIAPSVTTETTYSIRLEVDNSGNINSSNIISLVVGLPSPPTPPESPTDFSMTGANNQGLRVLLFVLLGIAIFILICSLLYVVTVSSFSRGSLSRDARGKSGSRR